MQYNTHSEYRNSRRFAPPRIRSKYRDGFFHLPTELSANDPFLQRLYGVVSYVLDDHPYPNNSIEFQKRTAEIQRHVSRLHLSSSQRKFLDRLHAETGVESVDLWHGSHIIVVDSGYLYDRWSRLPVALPRFSSHYSSVPVQQFGIAFKDHQLLFGKTNPTGSTWFQMEAHAFNPNQIFDDPDLVVYHGQDFLKYRVHHMNVGPYGLSPHTETINPLVLSYRPLNLNTKRSSMRIKSYRTARFI